MFYLLIWLVTSQNSCVNFSLLIKILVIVLYITLILYRGFPHGSLVKNPPANAGDAGLIPGSGKFPGEGNDNPLWYSGQIHSWYFSMGNPMEKGTWRAIVGSRSIRHNWATEQEREIQYNLVLTGLHLKWLYFQRWSHAEVLKCLAPKCCGGFIRFIIKYAFFWQL